MPANFPTSAPALKSDYADNTDDVMAANQNQPNLEVNAIAAKVGTGASTPASGKVLTGTGAGTSSWEDPTGGDIAADIHAATEKTTPVDADELGLIDSAASYVLKKLSFLNLKLAVMSALNPVGTIREFNVATNPGTLLGFGTWAAHGTGRVTVAIDAGQTEFDTVDETGGANTVTLTGAQSGVPAHSHPMAGVQGWPTVASGAGWGTWQASGLNPSTAQKTTTNDNTAANAASAHNNLQPYIVVYRWVRTA